MMADKIIDSDNILFPAGDCKFLSPDLPHLPCLALRAKTNVRYQRGVLPNPNFASRNRIEFNSVSAKIIVSVHCKKIKECIL